MGGREHVAPGPQECRKLLTFVIVGGGPTGVEVAAELHDLIVLDLRKYYQPELTRLSRVLLVELGDHVLSTYDRKISEYTSTLFQRCGLRWSSCLCRTVPRCKAAGQRQQSVTRQSWAKAAVQPIGTLPGEVPGAASSKSS